MIRALLIRQTFIVLDLLLMAFVVLSTGMVVFKLFDKPDLMKLTAIDAEIEGSTHAALKEVRKRGVYNGILESGLFGQAGRFDPEEAPPPPPPVEKGPEVPTELNLRLIGTTATEKLSSAIIEDGDMQNVDSYRLNEAVRDQVTLKEVRPREVVLYNESVVPPRDEILSMDEVEEGPVQVASAPRPTMPEPTSDRITLNRNEFIQELYTNYADLVTKVQPEMYRDQTGKVIGVTANNISQVPLAKKLGLRDGDVLQNVNGEAIDSEQKIMEMVQKYRNSTSFRIGLMRNGKVQNVTYRLE